MQLLMAGWQFQGIKGLGLNLTGIAQGACRPKVDDQDA